MIEREVSFTPEAEQDLYALYAWISERASANVAIGYLERIEAFCNRLAIGSERGHLREDIRPNLRIIGFERRVTIAFVVREKDVVILRVFYGGQNWEDVL